MFNYNKFHQKNKDVQRKIINDRNYTYQSLISQINAYFKNKGDVLDFGCGVGTIDFYLCNKGFKVTGVDISDRAIHLANQSKENLKLLDLKFICSSLEDFKDSKKYDYIICSEVLEHVDDPIRIVNKIYSLLKDDGIAIISSPSLNAPLYKMGKLTTFDKNVGHLRRYNFYTLSKLLLNARFKIIKYTRTEGLLRNTLYTNNRFGKLLKFIRYPITILVNFIDNLLIIFLGESDLYFTVKK